MNERLREIKHILREYTGGIVPINQIARHCYYNKLPQETIHELGEKIYNDLHKGGKR